jgi:hypothetical protein
MTSAPPDRLHSSSHDASAGKFGRMGQRGQMTARDGLGSYPEPVPCQNQHVALTLQVQKILPPCLTWMFALSPRMLEAAYWARFAAKGRVWSWLAAGGRHGSWHVRLEPPSGLDGAPWISRPGSSVGRFSAA